MIPDAPEVEMLSKAFLRRQAAHVRPHVSTARHVVRT